MHAFYEKKVIFEMDILEALIDWLSIYIYFWEVSIFGKLSRNPVLQNSHHIWEATLKSELIFWRNSSPRLGLLRYEICIKSQWILISWVGVYQKLMQDINNSSALVDLYWALQRCTCDSNTAHWLVITLRNY